MYRRGTPDARPGSIERVKRRPRPSPSEDEPLDARRAADGSVVALLCVIALALIPRAVSLDEAFPSLDELWSLELSTGRGSVHLDLPVNATTPLPTMTEMESAPPWHAVWTSLDRVTHPPLYFLALRGWRELLGGGDVAARWLSVAASLAAIVLLYDATRLLTGSRATALWAAALMALAGPQIEHARLVRNYALLTMLAVLAWWAVARLRGAGGPRAMAYAALLAVSVVAMLLTHYFTAGAVAALLAYALLGMEKPRRRIAATAVAVGMLVWLIAWGPTLWRHASHFSGTDSTTDFLRRDTTGAARVLQTATDFAAVPARLLVELPQRHLPLAALPGLACVGLLIVAWRGRRRELLLPVLWLAGTIGSVAVLDLARSTIHLQAARYTLLASPGLFVLIAAGVGGRRAWMRHAVPAIVVLACLVEIGRSIYRVPAFDWRPLAASLDQPGRENDPVVFVRNGQPDWFIGHQVMAYAHASTLPPGRPVVVLDPPTPEPVLARLRASPRSWVFHMSGRPLDFDAALPGFRVTAAQVPDFPSVVGEARPE